MKYITCTLCLCLLFASLDLTTATAQSQTSSVIAQETPVELEPVVITATRTEQKVGQSTANVTVLQKDEIANSPAYVVDDMLRQIPGFNTFRRSSSLVTASQQDPEAQGVTLRGIGPGGASRALVLIDGIPANDAFGGWIYWGEMPMESIERAEIVRGGYSSLWGNFALAGVINLITRMPQERDILAKAAFGNRTTEDGYLSYNDKFGRLRFGIEGNAFHTNGWNIILPDQRGPIDQNSNSDHKRGAVRLDYALTPDLSLFIKTSYYDESRNNGTPFRTSQTARASLMGGGSLRTNDGDIWQLTVFSRFSRFEENFSGVSEDRTTERPTQLQKVPSTDVGGSLTYTTQLGVNNLLTAGSDFRLISGESRDSFFDDVGTINDQRTSKGRQTFTALFVQDIYEPLPKLQIVGTLRADYFRNFDGRLTDIPTGSLPTVTSLPEQERIAINPKLALRYELLEHVAVRAAGYRAYRAPTLSELYRRSSVEGLVLKENPNLGPEFLDGGEVGFDVGKATASFLRATAYWNTIRHPIGNISTARDPVTGEDSERTRANLGRARVRGVEADVQYQLTKQWSVIGGYLYSEAVLTSNPAEPDLEGKRLTQVPWHSGTVGIRYTNPALINVLAQARFVGKQFEDADNMDKLAGYYVIDLSISRSLKPFPSIPGFRGGQVFLIIQNLLNREYIVDRGGGIFKTGTPFLIEGGVRLEF
jgi:outer membrane receptor protein involved in Fe transport